MQLVTWNTQWCCNSDGQVDLARIVQDVHALGECDVLCLQDIAVNSPPLQGAPPNPLQQLQALMPGWQIFFGPAVDEFTAQGRQQFGNLIASRLPVLQVQHHTLPYPADIDAHSMPRMCTAVTVQDPQLGPIRVMTTHLEHGSKRQRMSQAQFLRHLHLEELSHCYVPGEAASDASTSQAKHHTLHTPHAVLCGDFSLEDWEPEYGVLASEAAVIECLETGWPEQVVGARLSDAWRVLHPQQAQPHGTVKPAQPHLEAAAAQTSELVWVSNSLCSHVRSFEVCGLAPTAGHQAVRVVIGG